MSTMSQRQRDALDRHITGDFRFYGNPDRFTHLYRDEQEDDMPDIDAIDTERITAKIQGLLHWESEEGSDIVSVVTFEDAGVLTSNDGLVVRLADGSEYQVTVVRSR